MTTDTIDDAKAAKAALAKQAKDAAKPIAIPKTLGACVDLLYKTREDRLAIDRQAEALKAVEKALAEHILQKLAEQDMEGTKGKTATFSKKKEIKASVTDWPKFYQYAVKNKDFDLLYKQAGIRALRERWDNGKTVPGVEQIEVMSYSLTKVGAK